MSSEKVKQARDAGTVLRYQQLMEDFLQLQQEVMLKYLRGRRGTEPLSGQRGFQQANTGAPAAPTGTLGELAVPIRRFRLSAVESRSLIAPGHLAAGRPVIITDDRTGLAKPLAERLQSQGHAVVLLQHSGTSEGVDPGLQRVDFTSADEIERALSRAREAFGPAAALIHLLPLGPLPTSFEDLDLNLWSKRLSFETRSLFLMARALSEDLAGAVREGGAAVLATTGMGGAFGSDATRPEAFFPGQGAVTGFLKTLAKEWPEVRVKAVDLDPSAHPESLVKSILAELAATDGQVEVGYQNGRRQILQSVVRPLLGRLESEIDSDSVLLLTGGARGITAEVALELAERYRPTLLLVGRSPLPGPESSDTLGLESPQEIKTVLITRVKRQGRTPVPAEIERAYWRLLKEREIRANLSALEAAGARVQYYSVDVRDEEAFGHRIDEVYRSFGRIDGVIHGAGIIEDKLVRDKTVESFDRVFGTKVESAFILSRHLRPDLLKFLVFFSSVAGRFGNPGQGDYGAANEVLNKLAIFLDQHWPCRVVSINWGPWDKRGMVSAEVKRQFARRGIVPVPVSVGRRMLDEEIRGGRKGEAEIMIAGESLDGRSTAAETPSFWPLLESVSVQKQDHGLEIIYRLDPGQDRILNDHRLEGRAVLPAAEAMELMAEAAKRVWPEWEVVRLREIRVQRGLILRSGPQVVRIAARSQAQVTGRHILVVQTEITDTSAARRPFYRATVELAKELPAAPPYQARYQDALERFSETPQEAYSNYLFHGPTLQCIAEIEGINRQGIVARVVASRPEECLAWRPRGGWVMDPVVIDSAFQLAIIWARVRHDVTPLPAYFQVYRRFGPLEGSDIRCYLHSQADPENLTMTTHLFFVSAEGTVLGEFEGAESTCSKTLNRLAGEAEPARMDLQTRSEVT